jgi:hypothetical protein
MEFDRQSTPIAGTLSFDRQKFTLNGNSRLYDRIRTKGNVHFKGGGILVGMNPTERRSNLLKLI